MNIYTVYGEKAHIHARGSIFALFHVTLYGRHTHTHRCARLYFMVLLARVYNFLNQIINLELYTIWSLIRFLAARKCTSPRPTFLKAFLAHTHNLLFPCEVLCYFTCDDSNLYYTHIRARIYANSVRKC